MRIGELSRRSGLSRDTLRFYERRGLIRSAPGRSRTNTYRDYPEAALEILTWIGEAQAAGMTLADLERMLLQLDAADPDAFDAERFLDDKIAEVEARIARSQRFLETLRATRRALA